jgi:arylsulfatase A-like enzyme
VHPGAIDVADNGIDENCSGADAKVASYGARATPRAPSPSSTRPSIVVISVDALRADRLGAYGYTRPTSPALDALAASGVRFGQAFTACPSTRCAIPALHTGRFASTLPPLTARAVVPSLASTLAAAGYATAAITCCERFASARGELTGFAHVDATADSERMARAGQSNADAVIDRALAWVQTRTPGTPYLLWVHLYEPHFPYEAPSGPSFGGSASDRYDREVAFADSQIARLVAALDASTVVVVTSDHGEELGEHGIRFHARSLYNQVVRVPLIVRAPGAAPRVVDTPVSLVDVMPTLLDLAGATGPAGMNGVSLVPALRGQPLPPRAILVELPHDHQIARDMAAAIQPPWKVVWDREVDAWSLYRLDDTADANPVDDAASLATMREVLMDLLDRETGSLPP